MPISVIIILTILLHTFNGALIHRYLKERIFAKPRHSQDNPLRRQITRYYPTFTPIQVIVITCLSSLCMLAVLADYMHLPEARAIIQFYPPALCVFSMLWIHSETTALGLTLISHADNQYNLTLTKETLKLLEVKNGDFTFDPANIPLLKAVSTNNQTEEEIAIAINRLIGELNGPDEPNNDPHWNSQ